MRKPVLVAENLWWHRPRGPLGLLRGESGLVDASIQLFPGEVVCIVGPSGSGKSTLMRLLALERKPSEGTIQVLGRDVAGLSGKERDDVRSSSIHYIPQRHFGLIAGTARHNVTYWLKRLDGLTGDMAEERARRALNAVGLDETRFDRRVDVQLSGGERTRVAISVAYARGLRICLADEPFEGLDRTNEQLVMAAFRELAKQNVAVAVIMHQDHLLPHFDRVYEVRDKKLRLAQTNPKAKLSTWAAPPPPPPSRPAVKTATVVCRRCRTPLPKHARRCPRCGQTTGRLRRRRALLGLAGLLVAGGAAAARLDLASKLWREETSTPAANLPAPGSVLWAADSGSALRAFAGSGGWEVDGDILTNDGTNPISGAWVSAPYQPGAVADYAVEVELQIVRINQDGCSGSVGIVARSTDEVGYLAGLVYGLTDCRDLHLRIGTREAPGVYGSPPIADATQFTPGSAWHTYRVEVNGSTIRFLVDGRLMVEGTDDRHSQGGQVGLWSDATSVNVRRFVIVAA